MNNGKLINEYRSRKNIINWRNPVVTYKKNLIFAASTNFPN